MKNVLIIEDDTNIVDLLEIHLKDLECNVTSVNDGISGLETATKGKYDLIILDVMLPRMEGMEVCRQIRAQKKCNPYFNAHCKI